MRIFWIALVTSFVGCGSVRPRPAPTDPTTDVVEVGPWERETQKLIDAAAHSVPKKKTAPLSNPRAIRAFDTLFTSLWRGPTSKRTERICARIEPLFEAAGRVDDADLLNDVEHLELSCRHGAAKPGCLDAESDVEAVNERLAVLRGTIKNVGRPDE